MYRPSDSNCSLPDAAPASEKDIPFRLKVDCLSEEATNQVSEVFVVGYILFSYFILAILTVHAPYKYLFLKDMII